MSSLTQKLVSSRTTTLIGDISKDYPSAESVKDNKVFLMVSHILFSIFIRSSFLHFYLGTAGIELVTAL